MDCLNVDYQTVCSNNNNVNITYYIKTGLNSSQSECYLSDYINGYHQVYNKRKKFYDTQLEDKNNIIFYEKTPRYYLYPHIAYIYSNVLIFKNCKIFVRINS